MGVPGKVTLGDERRRRNREVFLFAFSFSPLDHQLGTDEDWRPDGTRDIFLWRAQTRRTRTKS
jgi:hypothetical protein